MSDGLLAEISVAVTEAVGNVVMHAYRDQPQPGDFQVETTLADHTVEITIRDTGCGPAPNPHSEGISMGIPLMYALADTLTIEGQDGKGTTVRMTFTVKEHTPKETPQIGAGRLRTRRLALRAGIDNERSRSRPVGTGRLRVDGGQRRAGSYLLAV